MKRSLRVVDELRDPPAWSPTLLRLGSKLFSVVDTGNGGESERFASALMALGALPVSEITDAETPFRVVIRGAPAATARLKAEVLEEAADLVLGSARPAFAKLLCSG